MSASNKQASAVQVATGELGDEQVREFLKANQDFLQRHPDMLDYLHISHASGSAISLVEKQVSVLRERNIDMRHRLSTLTGNARDNDKLYERTRSLVLKLIESESAEALCSVFLSGMKNDFGVDHACMILYAQDNTDATYRCTSLEHAQAEIGALIKGKKAVCGTLRAEELKFLFPEGGEVGSAALMPLDNGEPLGLIAVGSSDAHRYSSNVGTVFLSHIADVIVRLLPRMTATG
ncbi:MAG: DUF484 family protein [Gammaproteobacteria bacterium]|jgi:hypothetical protein|nr:DUF484 family protein [Gammaproteobacteria bacterium]